MENALSIANARQQSGLANSTAPNVVAVTGEYRGEVVAIEISDPLKALADAAEELTFLHSERASKSLSDRKCRDRAGRGAEIAEGFLKPVPDAGTAEQLYRFAQSLLDRSEPVSVDQLRQRLKDEYSDLSHQYAALQFLDQFYSETNAPAELLDTVRAVRAELDREHGPEIRAGLNVTNLATSFLELGKPQDLREFYRQTVLGFDELADTYQQIVDRYGADQFERATEFLIHAIGTEIGSFGPGVDPRQLKATVDSLYVVEVARNLNDRVNKLFEKIADQFESRVDDSAKPLLSQLLPLKDQRWVDASKIDAIVSSLGELQPPEKIYLLRELSTIVRELPEKIYQSSDDRERLRSALQNSLDLAIDAEGL